MTDRNLKVTLGADVGQYESAMKLAASATRSVGEAAKETDARTSRMSASTVAKGSLMASGVSSAARLVGRAFGASIKASMDFDQAMANVAATGAEAKASMGELSALARTAGADFGFGATESAAGIEALIKAGVSVSDVMNGGLRGSLALAAAGEMQVADAAEVASQAMVQFGLSGDQIPHIADLLAAGAGKAAGDVSDMAMALKQSGLVAAQTGLSLEETTGTLAAFASAGLLGSDAGTSFKTMLQKLSAPAKDAQKTMSALGISAYDAQGKFVGVVGLAGQMESAFKDMSDGERQAAMAIIFGSDAVRAASTIYAKGAEGMQEWIDKTVDAGYATRMAADRQNSVQGSVNKLRSAVENLSISLGTAANGPLKAIIEQITALANAAARHPEVAQWALTATAALVGLGAGALAIGKITAGIQAVAGVATALKGLSLASIGGQLKTAATQALGFAKSLGAVNLAALGVAGLVIGVGVAALNALPSDVVHSATEYAAELEKIALGSKAAAANLNSMAAPAGDANARISGLSDSLKKLQGARGILRGGNGWDAGKAEWDDFVKVVTGGRTVKGFAAISDNITALDEAVSKMKITAGNNPFTPVAEGIQKAGLSADDAAKYFPQLFASIRQTAAAAGDMNLTNDQVVGVINGHLTPALADQAAKAKSAGAATTELGDAQSVAAGLAEQQAQALDAARKALQAYGSENLKASGSIIGFHAALDDAAASVKENGRTLDVNTEKGRKNQSALDGVASSLLSMIDNQQKAGASAGDLTKQMASGRGEFVKMARSMGMTAQQAEALADKYGLVPEAITTNVTSPGAASAREEADRLTQAYSRLPGVKTTQVSAPGARSSAADVDALMRSIVGLPPEKLAAIRTIAELSGVNRAKAAIDNLHDKKVYLTTEYRVLGAGVTANGQPGSVAWNVPSGIRNRADGGIFEAFANGGIRDRPHVAEIARAGDWRVWAEDETGGEAYIPLAMSKRGRSTKILGEVARRFGYDLSSYANGALRMPAFTVPIAAPAAASTSTHVTQEITVVESQKPDVTARILGQQLAALM